MKLDANGREVLDRDQCLSLLGTTPLGRASVTMGALPVVVPVPFVVADSKITFPGDADPLFLAAIDGAVVAFEADDFDPHRGIGWSVVVQGLGDVTAAPANAGMFPLGAAWIGSDLGCVVVLPTEQISGRRSPRLIPASSQP